MNVLLYNTGDVRGELNEPIGIELLAAHVLAESNRQISLDMKWFNFDKYSFDPLQYDVIGVSIHINGLKVFENLCRLCCERGFKGLIIAGNSIATFAYKELLDRYPNIICILGEGEYAFKELIRWYQTGDPKLSDIPNLAYCKQGRLILTQPVVCDMGAYLPPLRMFNEHLKKHKGIARIEASRGCSWNQCSFCGAAHKYHNSGWRPIKIEVVLQQLIELSGAGLTTVYFCDEDFIGNDRERFSVFVDRIQEKMDSGEISSDMCFFISIKPTDIIDNRNMETIRRFQNCGLKELFVGLESGCENQLKRYHKCTSVKVNSLAIGKIKELMEHNMAVDIGFIFFDYSMTPADIEENIQFIEENQLYRLPSSLIKPLRIQPYTKVFEHTPQVHGNPFSVDDLMYQYHFSDHTVQQIYTAYMELQLETTAHKIQSAYRRELSSELERKQSLADLLQLRFLQFSAIKQITKYYIHQELSKPQLKSSLCEIVSLAARLEPAPPPA